MLAWSETYPPSCHSIANYNMIFFFGKAERQTSHKTFNLVYSLNGHWEFLYSYEMDKKNYIGEGEG